MGRLGFLLAAFAVTAMGAEMAPLRNLSSAEQPLRILAPAVPRQPFTVAGEYGAIFGRQDGRFEAWLYPVKILSNFRIRAELADYAVPIDVNANAAEIKVTPAETVITYSHSAFTIRQHMFSTRGIKDPVAAGVAYFEIESVRPLSITFSFTPEMLRMWPAANFGRPNGEWVSEGNSGAYVLHTDKPDFSAIVAMPGTKPGIMVPYQEHPQTYPLELKLDFDPKRDAGQLYPLVMALANQSKPLDQAASVIAAIPQVYAATQRYYSHFFDNRVTAETPDTRLNEALGWAEVAIDQAQVRYKDETGLIAGYYESADSARPGYAWFFGRDTLFTTYAINGYGDFELTRRALDFLFHRQRDDGKIMHEFSQSADAIDWKATPYFYASADSTNLLIMAMWDYVRTSGDTDYLQSHWDAVQKAYAFTRAHDSDGDGIYENTEGTGWVESWPPGMPHQEIYLAALDRQASQAISHLAALMHDEALSSRARAKATEIGTKIESEYFEAGTNFYAFSRNADGSLDHTATIYPAVAWWDGTYSLSHAGEMLKRWASAEFSTDWGTRDISDKTSFYDPISYHQGTVWPLFTGWVSLAEYRAGRPLSGYAHLMQNAELTWAQDLGSVTELLSGQFYQPLGRSSSHQLWSSAMVITPLLEGLFGLDWDATDRTLRVAPQLPADWDGAGLHNVSLGKSQFDLTYERKGGKIIVRAASHSPEVLCLASPTEPIKPCGEAAAVTHVLTVTPKPVELTIPENLPEQGAATRQLKALDESWGTGRATFTFAGVGGSIYNLPVRFNRPNVKVEGAAVSNGELHLAFPNGSGYQERSVSFTW